MTTRRLGGALAIGGLLAGLLSTGCSADLSGVGPSPEAELHLVTVEGKELPAAFSLPSGGELVVRSDVIKLRQEGRWERTRSFALKQGGEMFDGTLTETGSLTPVEAGWALDFQCDDVIIVSQCVPPDTLRPREDGARIQRSHVWLSLGELEFRTVDR